MPAEVRPAHARQYLDLATQAGAVIGTPDVGHGGGVLAEARSKFEEARPLLYGLGSLGTLVVTVLAPLNTIE